MKTVISLFGFSQAISRLYGSFGREDTVSSVIDDLSAFLDGSCLCLLDQSADRADLPLSLNTRAYADVFERYQRHFFRVNPYLGPMLQHPLHEPLIGATYVDAAALGACEFGADLHRPAGLAVPSGIVFRRAAGRFTNFTLIPRVDSRLDADAVAEILALLGPHMANLFRLARDLRALRHEVAIRDQMFDRLTAGVVLLDRTGRVLYANRAAEAHLTAGLALSQRMGRLCIRDATASAKLVRALAMAETGVVHHAIPLAFSAPSLDAAPSLPLLLVPLQDAQALSVSGSSPTAMLLIRANPGHTAGGGEALAAAFALTPAQGAVLDGLLRGLSVTALAAEQQIAVTTVRSHISAVLRRLECSRTSEAIAKVSRHPWFLIAG